MKYIMSFLASSMLATVGAEASLTKEKLYADAKKNCHPLNVANQNKCNEAFKLSKVEAQKIKELDTSVGNLVYNAEAKRVMVDIKKCKVSARAKMQNCAKVFIEGQFKEAARVKQEKKIQAAKPRKVAIGTYAADTTEAVDTTPVQQKAVKSIQNINNGGYSLEMVQQLVKTEVDAAVKREITAVREQMIQLARHVAKEEAAKVARIEAQFVAKEEAVRVANAEIIKIQRNNELRLKSQQLAEQMAEQERMKTNKAEMEQFMADTKNEAFSMAQEEIAKLAESVREVVAEEAIRVATKEAVKTVKAEATRLTNDQLEPLVHSSIKEVSAQVLHKVEQEMLEKVPVIVKVVIETPQKEAKAVREPLNETPVLVVEKPEAEAAPAKEEEKIVESNKSEPVLVEIIKIKNSPVMVEILEQEKEAVKELALTDDNTKE